MNFGNYKKGEQMNPKKQQIKEYILNEKEILEYYLILYIENESNRDEILRIADDFNISKTKGEDKRINLVGSILFSMIMDVDFLKEMQHIIWYLKSFGIIK